MTDVREIKDRTPNEATVKMLERMLEEAKSGELRTLITIAGYDDDKWSPGWVIDSRNSHMRMIGQMALLHNEILTNEQLRDADSVLSIAFND